MASCLKSLFYGLPGSLVLTVAAFFATPAFAQNTAEDIVVSIKPLHSLISGVMRGVGEPTLLYPAGVSVHTASLKPSQSRAIAQARVVFIVDEELERPVTRMLASEPEKIVSLNDRVGINKLPARSAGVFKTTHSHDHADSGGHADLHTWLSPDNAIGITNAAAQVLSTLDPENSAVFQRNAQEQILRIEQLRESLTASLNELSTRRLIVFHDATQYFEKAFGLNVSGAVGVSAGRTGGAKRVRELRQKIKDAEITCMFHEPQFKPKLIDTISEGFDVKIGVLDPTGVEVEPGENAWFDIMRNMATSIRQCLSN